MDVDCIISASIILPSPFSRRSKISHHLAKFLEILQLIVFLYLHFKQPALLVTSGYRFKVCKSVHHHTIQIYQPTRCNIFSSLWLDVYVQLNMFRASWRPTALLHPRSNGKTRGCYCSCWAPDDGREDARNMLSCTRTSSNKFEKLLHLVGWFIWIEVDIEFVQRGI